MSEKCLIVQNTNTLEAFTADKKEQFLQRVIELLGHPLSDDAKKVAGRIMEDDFQDFNSRNLGCYLFGSDKTTRTIPTYLGSVGKKT